MFGIFEWFEIVCGVFYYIFVLKLQTKDSLLPCFVDLMASLTETKMAAAKYYV